MGREFSGQILRLSRSCICAAALCGAASPAFADFKVHHPDAEPGETAVEFIGNYGMDHRKAFDNEQSHVLEIEHGFNNFWRSELEFEFGREPGPGNKTILNQITSENIFQLTERGQYWLDLGLFWEYGKAMVGHTPDETTFGPILRKEVGPTINLVNLFMEKKLGQYASGRPSFQYRWETRVDFGSIVQPGFQAYGEPGPFGHFAPIAQQDHRIGPQLFADLHQFGPGTLHMNGGLLFGLTPASPERTLRWHLEYELHF